MYRSVFSDSAQDTLAYTHSQGSPPARPHRRERVQHNKIDGNATRSFRLGLVDEIRLMIRRSYWGVDCTYSGIPVPS